MRGDLMRHGFVTQADVIAAEQLFADPHVFVKANPGRTRESLRHAANTDHNGISIVTFADPSRNVTHYAASLDMSVEQFLQAAGDRKRTQWDERYTATTIATYIRKGFQRR